MLRSICCGFAAILVGGCQTAPRAAPTSATQPGARPQVTAAAAAAPASPEIRYLNWLQKTEFARVEMTRRIQQHGIWFQREAATLPFQKPLPAKLAAGRPTRPNAAEGYMHLQYTEAHSFFTGLERSRPPVPAACAALDRHYGDAMDRASRAEENSMTAFKAHLQIDPSALKAQNAEIRSNLQHAENDLQSLCRSLKLTPPFHIAAE